ncbi:DUF3016 domain-containing protein [Oleiharenicola lentus]|uniref:DUF3016 domain-containing protein n=1 Tax=Oleiharenicola lentus TaxID=2508720 RepID=UPI003F670414
MKALFLACLVTCAVSAFAATAEKGTTRVNVVFSEPEKFTDLKEGWADTTKRTEDHRDFVLAELKKHIETIAQPLVAEGQRLEIKVTDINLAGDFEPWHGPEFDDIRVVKDLYPPRVNLEYRLIGAGDQVIREGKAQIRDLSYMMSVSLRSFDSLRYEKEMLRSWIRQEFRKSGRES